MKVAHHPLLAPGKHTMSLQALHSIAVLPYPNSVRRPLLFRELERLHGDVCRGGLVCELWIDGSFLSDKPEPDDIDVIFSCFGRDFDLLPAPLKDNILKVLNGGKAYSPYLDTYICFRFLKDDPRYKADKSNYWAGLWGKGWDDWLTGYVVIKCGETDVGLRLFA